MCCAWVCVLALMSCLYITNSQHTQHQLETLHKQLLIAEEQRDDALLQMSNAQEQAEQNAAALSNLENVLEQFQRGTITIFRHFEVVWLPLYFACVDQSSELASALKRTQSELADALEKCKMYREAQAELKTQLAAASSAAETATLLNVELEAKENEISRLTKESKCLYSYVNTFTVTYCTVESLHATFTKRLEQGDMMDR